MKEPVARGVVVALPVERGATLATLAKEAVSILKALDAEAEVAERIPAGTDFVLWLVEEASAVDAAEVPELVDRAAVVAGVAEDVALGRAAVAKARKRLRQRGAALGARELVFTPAQFGYLGLESDGLREKLEILLRTLVTDAERLRLKREGWEEPDERPHM